MVVLVIAETPFYCFLTVALPPLAATAWPFLPLLLIWSRPAEKMMSGLLWCHFGPEVFWSLARLCSVAGDSSAFCMFSRRMGRHLGGEMVTSGTECLKYMFLLNK